MNRSAIVAGGAKSRFRVYPVIGLLIFINTLIVYFARVCISVTAPEMMKELNWDTAVMGLTMSMFGVGYIITQVPGGWVADNTAGEKFWGPEVCCGRSALC
jgi:sugar phosphate permease